MGASPRDEQRCIGLSNDDSLHEEAKVFLCLIVRCLLRSQLRGLTMGEKGKEDVIREDETGLRPHTCTNYLF